MTKNKSFLKYFGFNTQCFCKFQGDWSGAWLHLFFDEDQHWAPWNSPEKNQDFLFLLEVSKSPSSWIHEEFTEEKFRGISQGNLLRGIAKKTVGIEGFQSVNLYSLRSNALIFFILIWTKNQMKLFFFPALASKKKSNQKNKGTLYH